ncbi:MAG: hypothetical protein OIF57_10540, partial [Marinobacterium sp.]|nr:hypothetical protein [Marinobacterium sp.]
MARQHQIAVQIDGRADGGVRAVRLTRAELDKYAEIANRANQANTRLSAANQQAEGSFTGMLDGVGRVSAAVTAVTGVWSGLSTMINAQIIRDNQALAQSIDISIGSLQAWQYAGKAAGVNAEKMGSILKDVTERLGEFARNGGGEAADALEELGLAAADFEGLTADEKLLKLGEAITKVDDQGKKVSFMEELADEASRLLPLLDNNAQKLLALKAEAAASGIAMSDADVQTVMDYAEAWDSVSGALGGVQNRLTVLVGNTATDHLNGLAETIRDNAGAVEYLDDALVASASVMAARYMPAVVDKTKAQYEAIKANYESVRAQVESTETEYESIKANYESIKAQRESTKAKYESNKAQYEATETQYESVKAVYESAKANAYAAEVSQAVAAQEVSRLQSSLQALDAEQRIEKQRMDAQISAKGRLDTAVRMGEIGHVQQQVAHELAEAEKVLAVETNQLAAAEKVLVGESHQLTTAKEGLADEAHRLTVAEKVLAVETRQLTMAEKVLATETDNLAAAGRRYNIVGQLTATITSGLKGALALIGGPAGVAFLAGTAIFAMAQKYETAEERTRKLKKETKLLITELSNANVLKAGSALDAISASLQQKWGEIKAASNQLAALQKQQKAGGYGGSFADSKAAVKQLEDRLISLSKEYVELSNQAEIAGLAVEDAMKRDADATGRLVNAEGKLTATGQALLDKYKAKQTRLQQLKADKQQLLSLLEEEGVATDKVKERLAELNKQLAEEAKRLKDLENQKRPMLEQMQEEFALMKAGEKAQYIANKLRSVSTEELKKHGHQLAVLAGQMYDHEQAARKSAKATTQITSATQEATKEVDPFAKAWENAFDNLDDAGRNLFTSLFDDMDSFVDAAANAAKRFAGEWLWAAARGATGIDQMFSQVASGGAAQGSAHGGFSMPSMPNFSGLSDMAGNALDFFNPASGGTTAFINSQAQSLGYGMAADGMGPPSQLLIDPGSSTAAGLNAVAPGLTAFALSQQYGVGGGLVGGAGSVALSGGISSAMAGGGFMSGATGALSGLGPVGWAAIGIGALAGLLGGEPSDKTQWGGFTGDDNHVYSGGENGEKFSEQNRNAATQIAQLLSGFDAALDKYSGVNSRTSYQVTVGDRDGIGIKADNDITRRNQLLYTPNGSADLGTGDFEVYGGDDLNAALDAAVKHMASQAGVLLTVYEDLQAEGEPLAVTYERLNLQLEAVRGASEHVGLQFEATGAAALKEADALVQSAGGLSAFIAQNQQFEQLFYTGAERQQKVYDEQLERYDQLNDVLTQNGMSVVKNAAEYRAAITAINGSTAAGAQLRAELLQYQQTVAFLDAAVTAARNAGASGVETFYDLQHASEKLTDTIARVASEAELVTKYSTQLGWGLQFTGDQMLTVADQFVQAAGGAQRFSQQMSMGWSLLYSESERASIEAEQAARRLGELNAEQGLLGDSIITTINQARAYADAQDKSTEAGQRAYLAAIEMAQAIDTLNGSMGNAATTAGGAGAGGGAGTVAAAPDSLIDTEGLYAELAAAREAHSGAELADQLAAAETRRDNASVYFGEMLAAGFSVSEWQEHWAEEARRLGDMQAGYASSIDELTAAIAAAEQHNAAVERARADAAKQPDTSRQPAGIPSVVPQIALHMLPGAQDTLMKAILSESGYLEWLIEQRRQPVVAYNQLHDAAVHSFADLGTLIAGLEQGTDAWTEAVNLAPALQAVADARAQLAELQQTQLAQVQGGAEGYWQQYLDAESEIERMYESRLEQLDAEKLLVEQLSRQ